MIRPATRSIGGALVAVVNVISGPRRLEPWIQQSFRDTLGTLDGVDGLMQFGLVRVSGSGRAIFASITVWSSLDAFERWRSSPAFTAAHPDRDVHPADFAELSSLRVDFPVKARADGPGLVAEIMRRLQTAHPALVPADTQLVHELQWPDDPDRASVPRTAVTQEDAVLAYRHRTTR